MKLLKYIFFIMMGSIMGALLCWVPGKQGADRRKSELAEVFREISMNCIDQKNGQLFFKKNLPSEKFDQDKWFIFYTPSFIKEGQIDFNVRDRLVVAFMSLDKKVVILTEALQVYEVQPSSLQLEPHSIWWNGRL